MRTAIILSAVFFLFTVTDALAQKAEFSWIPDQSTVLSGSPLDVFPPYAPGRQSGARGVYGPCDLDNDGKTDLLVTDYTGGGRVYMVEAAGPDMWEVVYASSSIDSTGTSQNARFAACSDLDDDGFGEVVTLIGRGYSATNPLAPFVPPGLYVVEAAGDNDIPLLPPFVMYTFPDTLPDRFVSEKITVADVDGDGVDEIMLANNGGTGFNYFDNWYVLSVTDLDPFFAWNQEARWSTRASEDFDPVNRGGGSAYSIIPADLDGDGTPELALSSWNNLNFTNVDVTGPDTYVAPAAGDTLAWFHASSDDETPLFGCVAVDLDMNGDDEVFCPVYPSGNVTLLNYEAGEDATQIDADNVVYEILSEFSALGLVAGDIDGDGRIELIGSGPGYSATAYANGEPPTWIRIADFWPGTDVEDPANYSVRDIPFPDEGGAFNVIYDSTGSRLESPSGGAEFSAKIAFLGDADGDGHAELAFSMQSVPDSLYTFQETYPNDSTTVLTLLPDSTVAYANRAFLRIFSGEGLPLSFTEDRVIVPQDYVLGANYPNPFNPTTTFSFTLPLDKRISVLVYDITGRLVRTLIRDETFTAGTHQATWHGVNDSGTPVSSGQYFYVLRYGNFQQARSMILIK